MGSHITTNKLVPLIEACTIIVYINYKVNTYLYIDTIKYILHCNLISCKYVILKTASYNFIVSYYSSLHYINKKKVSFLNMF